MAETKKKSQYSFGGHKFDTALYLLNLKDNAESFLNSKTDWTPEQKEEWKHSYTNFTNALLDLINNNTDRFSTDEFGTIIDRNGEFSNTDSDNFYYNNKGLQISLEDYDKLKAKKQGKYQTFEANRQFASYASLIGKGLKDALEARKATSDDTEGFDYAKNGFDAYWQKKYNPAGTANDMEPYWARDNEGEYTNRISDTLTDLDDYMANQEMDDKVKAAYQNYRDILAQYNPKDKDFNLDKWKNNLIIAANRAGIGLWNNGYFNIGSIDSKKEKTFDINNDLDVIDRYNLADQIAAHPELRDHIIDLARRQYNKDSQKIEDDYNAAIKLDLDAKNNKIWQTYLANNPYLVDVNKRIGRSDTTAFWSGARSTKKDENYISLTIMSLEEQNKVHANPTKYKGLLRPELQAALKNAGWNTQENPLLLQLNISTTTGLNLKNLGNWYQYNWDLLMARRDRNSMTGWTAVKDSKGNEVWKRNDSFRKSDGTYFYMFKGRDGKLHTYRSKPYSTLKSEITKGLLGMSIMTKNAQRAEQNRAKQKAAVSALTAKDKGRTAAEQKAMEREGFTGTDIARLASIGMDMGSLAAAYTGPETLGAGTLVSAGLGAASTATNFFADLADGESLSNAGKAAVTGLGMDALGLIPGAGAASKSGKMIKTAVKYVPRILAYLGTLQGVLNMPYIISSFKKLGTNLKLTVDDYRNMALGIGLITGIGAAGSRKIRNNKTTELLGKQKVDFSKLRNKSILVKQSGLVALKFKDKLDNVKSFVFKGEDANAIKNAKSAEDIKAITSKYSKLRNYELVNSKALRPHLRWIRKDGNWLNPLHRVDNPIRKYDVYENAGGIYTNLQGIRGWFMPYGGDKISKSDVLGIPRKAKLVKTDDNIIKLQVLNAVNERAANENLLKDFQAASDMRRQAKNSGNNQDYHDAITLLKEAWNKLQGARTEYNKLRNMVKNGSITFGSGRNKVQADWKDILAKYKIAYKKGGSILKFGDGGVNGSPYATLESFGTYDPANYAVKFVGDLKGMLLDGTYGAKYTSQGVGLGQGRIKTDKNYSTFTDEAKEQAKSIENQKLYKNYTEALIKSATDYLNTPEMERSTKWNKDNNEFLYWAEQFDNLYADGDKGRFFSSPGVLNTSWKTTNNDSYNNPAGSLPDLVSRIKAIRNDQLLAGAHNDREQEGIRYFWEENGVKHWVDAANIDKLDKTKFNVGLFGDSYDDNAVHWKDYKITAKSKTDASKDKNPENNPNSFNVKDVINNLDITDKWGIPRAIYADRTNRLVTDMLKKQPLLLDPQEDHRYVQSDLDAEMNGLAVAALLSRLASLPMTSDGNLLTAALLDAIAKGNEAITLGRQQSNLRLREMTEKAWELEVINHSNRHKIAMDNRLSIYNTKNENNSLEAAYLNLKFTVWDALAQEKEFKEKSDYEQMRARADKFAQNNITNSVKYNLKAYLKLYGLDDDDLALWNDVMVNGSKNLSDVQKNPADYKRWMKVLQVSRQILQDLLGEYYGIPKSKYWAIRLGEYSPTITTLTKTPSNKKGGHINLCKIREAAKGEKLAAALLKAQTADADRFYKTTKDHIDRMYDAINRLTNYSSTKKKRKKKSN